MAFVSCQECSHCHDKWAHSQQGTASPASSRHSAGQRLMWSLVHLVQIIDTQICVSHLHPPYLRTVSTKIPFMAEDHPHSCDSQNNLSPQRRRPEGRASSGETHLPGKAGRLNCSHSVAVLGVSIAVINTMTLNN